MSRKRKRLRQAPTPEPVEEPPRPAPAWLGRAGLAVVLLLLAVVTYWPVRHHDFVNYDDDDYVTENTTVQQGLDAETLRWAWTSTEVANWHPLTWISHLADVELFGMDAGAHHMTSVWLHALSTLLLYVALGALTGGWWRSGVVAALFAVHPMHVESVAWIAERKDVLSGLFWMATLGAYAWYAARPSWGRYLAVFCAMAVGLTAKPMLVSLPFVLLLLDLWPLRRGESWSRLVVEKLPLLGLAVASSVITVLAQSEREAFSSLETYSLAVRAASAVAAYGGYIGKLFLPLDLAVFYPHPGAEVPTLRVAGGLALLVAVSALAWWQRRQRPYILVGWLWFVGTLVPVIGIVQVGGQAMADRYTYLPYVGAFIVLVWGGAELIERFAPRRSVRAVLATAAVVPVALLAVLSRGQIQHWRDTVTLFEHAIEVTGDNVVARINLAEHLGLQGRPEEALVHLRAALVQHPNAMIVNYNMGLGLNTLGRYDEAQRFFERTLRLDPTCAEAHIHLGNGMLQRQRFDEAFDHFSRGAELVPDDSKAHFNMGVARAAQHRWEEAAGHYRRALELRPDYGRAHFNLSVALYGLGRYASALEALKLARRHGHDVPPGLIERLTRVVAEGGTAD